MSVNHYDYSVKGVPYPAVKQAQDFFEAFSSAAFGRFLGESIDGLYNSGVDPSEQKSFLNAEEATILASLVTNAVNEALSYCSGTKSLADAVSDTLTNNLSSFLQSQLFGKILSDNGITGKAQVAFKGFLIGTYSSAIEQLKHFLD